MIICRWQSDSLQAKRSRSASLAALLQRIRDTALKSSGRVTSNGHFSDKPIAIIGMACRLPGIKNIAEYWEVLRSGVETIQDIPSSRWDVDAIYDPKPGKPGKMVTRRGGFIEGLDLFDPYFFGISPREAVYQDPQQRLMLETAWEAMEDAGVLPNELLSGHAGTILGVCQNEYASMQQADLRGSDLFVASGGGRAAAGRLCTALGMDGPATTVDTACSSSLVAVHLACNAIRYGDADLMFAGGVNIILTPTLHVGLSQGGMISPDGRCKAFDISADGYVRSEGAAMVLLKPLDQALADGNQIHAVIRATAMTNDGPHSPMNTPSRLGQELALREAYGRAGVVPADVQYVEAHGTGTRVGDPIEMEALTRVLGPERPAERPLYVGSCKTNIGHTEAAAGVAGLIKTTLSMKHGLIPASLHYHTPNPNIPWDDIPVDVPRELTPWPRNGSAAKLAGVNSFGISGTNVHAVIESAPERSSVARSEHPKHGQARLLALSARTEESLRLLAEAYHKYLESPRSEEDSIEDICYTAALRRVDFDHRLGIVGGSRTELANHLRAFLDGEHRHDFSCGEAVSDDEQKPVFVFSGAGSHWAGMGKRLYEEDPAFAAALGRCDKTVREHAGWSVLEEIDRPESASRCGQIEFQPVLVAFQIALFEMWRSWGVEPAAVVGHSVGEYSAAFACGALTLEEAMRAVCTRSGLMKRLGGKGRMLAVGLSATDALLRIADVEDRVSVGVVSGPESTVLSGDPEPLEEIMARLEKEDIFCRWVKVDVASHSPQTDDVARELAEALRDLRPRQNQIPIYSTVTGDVLEGTRFGGEYWMANMRGTVLFAPAIEKVFHAGHRLLVEVSPHPLLAFAIDQTAKHAQIEVSVGATVRRDEDSRSVPLQALAGLYARGYRPPWQKLFTAGGRVVSSPSYQWQRESFWLPMSEKGSKVLVKSQHAYLGYRWESAQHAGTYTWDSEIDLRDFPYLADHRHEGTTLFPAAGHVELALAGSIEAFGPGPRTFRNIELIKALRFPNDQPRRVQLVLTPDPTGMVSFKIFCSELQVDSLGTWVLYSKGTIELSGAETESETAPDLESVRETYPGMDSGEFYRVAEKIGLGYGPSFQCIQQSWCRGSKHDAFAVLQLPEPARQQAAYHAIHPGLLDGFLHCYAAFSFSDAAGEIASLPVGIDELLIQRLPKPDETLICRFRLDVSDPGGSRGEVHVFDEEGKLVLREIGHRSKSLHGQGSGSHNKFSQWLYQIEWEKQPWPEVDANPKATFLIFGDRGGLGRRLKEAIESRDWECIWISGDGTEPKSAEDFDTLLESLRRETKPPYQIVYLWALDANVNADLNLNVIASDQKRICGNILLLVQAIVRAAWETPPRLSIITRGAQPVELADEAISLSQAPLIGMGRTIGNENPALRSARIDLDPAAPAGEDEQLLREITSSNAEREVAFRADQRYTVRMVQIDSQALESQLTRETSLADEGEQSCELEITETGILDNLRWRSVRRRAPGPGEVEIRIIGTALNFLDVLRGMGMMPGAQPGALQFGMECSGRIVRLGEGVRHLRVGDEVLMLDAKREGLLRAYTTVDVRVVHGKPEHLTSLEAVTMPVVYQTAYYSLHHLARLRKGESILIHSAAGGVGLAALELAQQVGAEVYATAGNEEKREYLQSRGIQHVLDSHSLDFADEILALTDGRGVDVVLNSLAGEAISKSLSTLATGGRFVEIGKRDIYENSQIGLWPFQKNLSFFAVDLLRLSQERPEFVAELTAEIFQKIADGTFKPLPYHEFPARNVADAFRFMAQGKHIGKVIVTLEEDEVEATAPLQSAFKVEAEATYLITGGLGALGLLFATALAKMGARHLALLGRRGETPESKPVLDALREAGVEVRALRADVSRADDVRAVLAEIDASMPPLKGVIHSAVVLDDGVLQQFDWSRFETVFAPKIDGVWNLQTLLSGRKLDFFSLFSSAASVFGNPGQGNYSAANAFLDSLAHYRRGRGEPAVNINWGPWAEIGLAAAQANRGERLALEGLEGIPPQSGVETFIWLMALDLSGALIMPIDWPTWVQHRPEILTDPLLGDLARHYADPAAIDEHTRLIETLRSAAGQEERQELVAQFLRGQISKVLKLPEDRVDRRTGLNRLGLDSLMAIEFKNRIESILPVTISVVRLLEGPNLGELSEWIEEQLSGGVTSPEVGAEPTSDGVASQVDQMTDKEVADALAEAVKAAGTTDG